MWPRTCEPRGEKGPRSWAHSISKRSVPGHLSDKPSALLSPVIGIKATPTALSPHQAGLNSTCPAPRAAASWPFLPVSSTAGLSESLSATTAPGSPSLLTSPSQPRRSPPQAPACFLHSPSCKLSSFHSFGTFSVSLCDPHQMGNSRGGRDISVSIAAESTVPVPASGA